ncbi:MAG: hypothetical protein ACON49_07010 [Candidatus Puniceispirillaceae bacterium]
MPPIDPTIGKMGAIIPFAPRSDETPAEEISTIVAIVAVTLRHDHDETPDSRLADLIEQSGEADILDIQDACADLAQADMAVIDMPSAANDNGIVKS